MLHFPAKSGIVGSDNRIPYKEWLRDEPDDARQPSQNAKGGKSRSAAALADKVDYEPHAPALPASAFLCGGIRACFVPEAYYAFKPRTHRSLRLFFALACHKIWAQRCYALDSVAPTDKTTRKPCRIRCLHAYPHQPRGRCPAIRLSDQ